MNFRAYIAKGREYSYILCPHAKHQKAGQCCKKYCREADVNEMVWHSIRNLMDMADRAAKKLKKCTDKTQSENLRLAKKLEKLHESEAAADDGVRDAVATMKKYSGEQELTKEIVDVFIDRILIYDPKHIEIQWKLPDEVIKFIEG